MMFEYFKVPLIILGICAIFGIMFSFVHTIFLKFFIISGLVIAVIRLIYNFLTGDTDTP